jgi:hypothetical protein
MARQTAVIIERQFVDEDGKVAVFRHPQWQVACWDAIEALPDDDARWWALEKLLWGLWEREVPLERILAQARQCYRERDAQALAEQATAADPA